jgi:protein-disulfide isomerase
MILDPFHKSPDPDFLDSTIAVDDGQNTKTSKRTSDISVTKDGRYLVMSFLPVGGTGASSIFPLGADANQEIARDVHLAFKVPDSVTVEAGTFRTSTFPNFLITTITADNAGKKQTVDAYVTKDHRYLILGNVYDMGSDPRSKALHTLVLQNQPETGSRNAPVTIVEFADLECPTCALTHAFLEKTLLPKYEGKIRLVFKEFPLTQIHEWAMTAAIANQCAYRINPQNYLPYRTLIFQHQSDFEGIKANASAVRDMLIDYGQQVGIDRLQLSGCVDSKASLPRIEENVKEAKALDVSSTPTFFINGKILIGGGPPEAFYQAIDDTLQANRKKK